MHVHAFHPGGVVSVTSVVFRSICRTVHMAYYYKSPELADERQTDLSAAI